MGTDNSEKTLEQKTPQQREEKKTRTNPPLGRLVPWGTIVSKITRPLFHKKGVGLGALILDWDQIVGSVYGPLSQPEKLTFLGTQRNQGVLKVRVHGPAALGFQHQESLILEKINRYFGYKAVSQLRIFQGPLPSRSLAPSPPRVRDIPLEESLLRYLDPWPTSLPEEEDRLRKAFVNLARDLALR